LSEPQASASDAQARKFAALSTDKENGPRTALPELSVTVMERPDVVPADEGVPVIAPVPVSKLNPPGSVPVSAKDRAPSPPKTDGVKL
jgi:hypothetical protein